MADLNPTSLLFCDEIGRPIHFLLRPSSERARLRPLIEERGGVMVSRLSGRDVTDDCVLIKLAVEGDKVNPSDDVFKTDYIDACLAANNLLPKENYVYKEPQNTSLLNNVSMSNGRSKYSEEDDDAILRFIANHPDASFSGNKIWKKMEMLKVTSHSWQSMRHRFLKKLHDKLPEFHEVDQQIREAVLTTDSFTGEEVSDHDRDDAVPPSSASGQEDSDDPVALTKRRCRPPDSPLSSTISDFDSKLIAEAEKHLTIKESETDNDAEDEESDSHHGKERAHGTHHRKLRLRKTASSSMATASNSDLTNETSSSEDTLNPGPKRRRFICYDTDSDGELEVLLGRRGSQKRQAAVIHDVSPILPSASVDTDTQQESQPLESFANEREDDEDEKVQHLVSFILDVTQRYSVPIKDVVQLLYIHDGVFESLLEHLRTGKLPEGMKIWNAADDDKLLNSSDPTILKELRLKYGEDAVMRHQEFIE